MSATGTMVSFRDLTEQQQLDVLISYHDKVEELKRQLAALNAHQIAYAAQAERELAAKDALLRRLQEDFFCTGSKTFLNQQSTSARIEELEQQLATLNAHQIAYAAQAERELAAKDADAARYKWLRNYMTSDDLTHDDALVAACANNNPDELDAAIDKELK